MRYTPGKPMGPQGIRAAARMAWGEVQSAKQVLPGVWAVDTAGHGGFIVAVGPSEPFQLADSLRTREYETTQYQLAGNPILTYYQFEEDCDWAVLVLAHPEVLSAAIRKGVFSEGVTLADAQRWAAVDAAKASEARAKVRAANPDHYATSARGDWAEGVEPGMVEVTLGSGRVIYMPKDAYRATAADDRRVPEQYL